MAPAVQTYPYIAFAREKGPSLSMAICHVWGGERDLESHSGLKTCIGRCLMVRIYKELVQASIGKRNLCNLLFFIVTGFISYRFPL
ncbi:hypothetical protein COLO4_03732 [Corchorus olitorius]|uniref:Uncharacterized protein n=1 Tax=Corchorus olitorius TaxID=93759 RepID=A0A1R3KXA1_9ROSI|nr:hypothetical protein COLO4_03732 [Corchorus olitorius]